MRGSALRSAVAGSYQKVLTLECLFPEVGWNGILRHCKSARFRDFIYPAYVNPDRHRLPNPLKRNDETLPALNRAQHSAHACQRAAGDFEQVARLDMRNRLGIEVVRQHFFDGHDFKLGDDCGLAMMAQHSHHAFRGERKQALFGIGLHENIAREQRCFDPFFAVTPLPQHGPQGQIRLQSHLLQLAIDALFKIRASVEGVPVAGSFLWNCCLHAGRWSLVVGR